MKKLLSILAAIGLTATTAGTVVSCADTTTTNPNMTFGKPLPVPMVGDNSGIQLTNARVDANNPSVITMDTSKPLVTDITDNEYAVVKKAKTVGANNQSGRWISKTVSKKMTGSAKSTNVQIYMSEPLSPTDENLEIYLIGFANNQTDPISVSTPGNLKSYDLSTIRPISSEGPENGIATLNGKIDGLPKGDVSGYLYLTSDNEWKDVNEYMVIKSAESDGSGNLTIELAIIQDMENYKADVQLNGIGLLNGAYDFGNLALGPAWQPASRPVIDKLIESSDSPEEYNDEVTFDFNAYGSNISTYKDDWSVYVNGEQNYYSWRINQGGYGESYKWSITFYWNESRNGNPVWPLNIGDKIKVAYKGYSNNAQEVTYVGLSNFN